MIPLETSTARQPAAAAVAGPVVRYLVTPYGTDRATRERLIATYAAWRGLLVSAGAGPLILEAHLTRRRDGSPLAFMALCCSAALAGQIEAALRISYANASLRPIELSLTGLRPVALRRSWLRGAAHTAIELERTNIDAVLGAMAAAHLPSVVQFCIRPSVVRQVDPDDVEGRRIAPERQFCARIRVLAPTRREARAIAATLATGDPAKRLRPVAVGAGRSTALGVGIERLIGPRWSAADLSAMWHLPSVDFVRVPLMRRATPLASAGPAIRRVPEPGGLLADDHGRVTIHDESRHQHVAVVGAIGQGKTSFLVASAREDIERRDCAVIVLDPKGDAADAAMSVIPPDRPFLYLDMARPTCGFNPLSVDAPIDAIADGVVAALRQLFAEGEVRGSSDRYLRNAVIAALACDRRASLWDVARLLSTGGEGSAARSRAAAALVAEPAHAEVAAFFADELPTQLADARATTTAKLDAPSNKLARVLNSVSVKRVLLNRSLVVDIDALIHDRGVLVVKGAMGEVGAGNVSVLMQLLIAMLDASLSRRHDAGLGGETTVALKVDEAPLLINPSFAQTLALKRSAGLEAVACWQTDSQWPVELRDQLDALFAHRVLFATASVDDARRASGLLMSEYSDQLRGGAADGFTLASPDTRLRLPRHVAIASWVTPLGRQRPFIGRTIPLSTDRGRIEELVERQRARGGAEVGDDLRAADWAELPSETTVQSPPMDVQLPGNCMQSPPGMPVTEVLRAANAEVRAMRGSMAIRWELASADSAPRRPIDETALAMLAWIATARCVTTLQVHARMHDGRALTTTQRRLRALVDHGLIGRFRLYGDEGGGSSFCCAATKKGAELCGVRRRASHVADDDLVPGLIDDMRINGWLLALEEVMGEEVRSIMGPGRARVAPPDGASLATLPLDPGVAARGFVHADPISGALDEVSTFVAVQPDAIVELTDGPDLLVVDLAARPEAVLCHYDHLLSGWWRLVGRWARRGSPPRVVVLCRGWQEVTKVASAADRIVTACVARIGTPAAKCEYPGRLGIWFVDEREIEDGSLRGLRLAPLPGEGAAIADTFGEPSERPGAPAAWH